MNNPTSADTWRKSSYSNPNNDCVELATSTNKLAIRDSKNPSGPTLTFPEGGRLHFLRALPTE